MQHKKRPRVSRNRRNSVLILGLVFLVALPAAASTATRAADTFFDPLVWAPLGIAAFLRGSPHDRRLANWSNETTPIFGNRGTANLASDELRHILTFSMLASTVASPAQFESWGKTKQLAAQLLIAEVNFATTTFLKDRTLQDRPLNPAARNGFPSAHASSAFTYATLINKNLDDFAAPTPLKYGVFTVATLVAWARLEAGQHYPSDTLVGIALGRFLANWLHLEAELLLQTTPTDKAVAVSLRF